ncbi:hypothetical protein ACGI10_26605, partial [Escherichia coli]
VSMMYIIPTVNVINNNSICTGPSGGVVCHGAAAARIFAIYENFSGKSVSVLLVYNSLFFHQSHP